MEVRIPFSRDLAEAVLDGKKTCVVRTRRYGGMGDTFEVVGRFNWCRCRITNQAQMTLENIARGFFAREGFDSPDGFSEEWGRLHPVKGFEPDQLVWLHEFEVLHTQGISSKGDR